MESEPQVLLQLPRYLASLIIDIQATHAALRRGITSQVLVQTSLQIVRGTCGAQWVVAYRVDFEEVGR